MWMTHTDSTVLIHKLIEKSSIQPHTKSPCLEELYSTLVVDKSSLNLVYKSIPRL